MKFTVFQTSRKGGREKNEDRVGYCYTRESGLLVLADGMGGHPRGEVAAQIALQTMSELFQKQARPSIKDAPSFLAESLLTTHETIMRYASDHGLLDTPRTTLVAVVLQQGQASWVHCGDSRLYVIRDGQLLTRTRDHSYVDHQRMGTGYAAMNRNVLFTCLGSPTKPTFDVADPFTLQQGDKILLCSDGLWGSLDESDILRHLHRHDLADAVPQMVEHALHNAGKHSDNVTALALEWEIPIANESAHDISTDTISEGEFASTIQAGVFDAAVDDFDDAAIERSIAEINDTIRRASTKSKKT